MNNLSSKYILAIATSLLWSMYSIAQSVTQNVPGNYNFTVPCGVTEITVEVWGAGGGGGGKQNPNGASGGGGGGAYARSVINVNPGDLFALTVGAGGAGGAGNNNGAAGGNSSFDALVIAQGGRGGFTGENGLGGNGGAVAASLGDIIFAGGNGGNGNFVSTSNYSSGGGGGGAGSLGAGGDATGPTAGLGNTEGGNGGAGRINTNGNGNNGILIGGGGSGATRTGGNNNGGRGANGQIRITWTPSMPCTSNTTSTTITDCAPINWTDGGGVGGSTTTSGVAGNYGDNQNYTYTFCPDNPDQAIRVDFHSFVTENPTAAGVCLDPMSLWMANSNTGPADDVFCGNLGAFSVISTSPDGCVTFEFRSDGSVNRAGWSATVYCITGCTNPTSALADASPLNICSTDADTPGSLTVNFDGSASSAGAGWSVAAYVWDFGDGNTATTGSATTSHTYSEAGVYVAQLIVRDNNTGIFPQGCGSTNATTRIIRVIPEPAIDASPVTTSCNTCTDLSAVGTSQTYVQPLPEVITGAVSLPDGTGVSYESPADYSGFFPDGATVLPGCYPIVCFDLEHSWSGDLDIELVSPNGTSVRLYSRALAGNNSFKFGDCVNGADNLVPGCGRDYCVVADGSGTNWNATGVGQTTPYANASNVPDGCDIDASWSGACETGTYYIGQTYNSSDSFSAFDGDQLNGVWTIRITDNIGADDGTLFGWSMTFPADCYRDLEFVTPDITDVEWLSGEGIPGTENISSVVVDDPGPDPCPGDQDCIGNEMTNTTTVCYGEVQTTYTYDYRITDEFGCQYTRSFDVEVVCPLPVELLSFTGQNIDNVNTLNWSTATERNNDYFTLERSTDGINWKTIRKVSGAGTSNATLNYSFDDLYYEPVVNYYRLTQTDYDGSSQTFIPVMIDNRGDVKLIKTVNSIGQEVNESYRGLVIEYYSDGSTVKRIR